MSLYRSLRDRLGLPDHVLLYPAHCWLGVRARALAPPRLERGLRAPDYRALRHGCEDAFVEALLRDIPPAPE